MPRRRAMRTLGNSDAGRGDAAWGLRGDGVVLVAQRLARRWAAIEATRNRGVVETRRAPRQLRSPREIAEMRKAGLLVWHAHRLLLPLLQPGVTTAALNAVVERYFHEQQAEPLFKNVPNASRGGPPFPAATCISVNEEVVHGIPGPRQLVEGDIVSVDTGCRFNGWCGDAAATYAVGRVSSEKQHLLDVTRQVLSLAIELMGKKSRWNEVAAEMEKFVRAHGFSVVEDFVGHGIGRGMHEEPQVPNFVSRRAPRSGDFPLEAGLVIAVEPMVNAGSRHVRCLRDAWTQATRDQRPSAHFEHTIAITAEGPIVLTAGPNGESW